METQARYLYQADPRGMNRVVYKVIASGALLCRDFASPYLAHQFAMKLKHSKKCMLVSWPLHR